MRLFGSILTALGILLGVAVGVFCLVGGGAFGLTWLASVAMAKLGFITALGFLGAGAVVHRIDRRREDRELPRSHGRDSSGD
jgi:hypothetical protein